MCKISKIEKNVFEKFLEKSEDDEVVNNIKFELKSILHANRINIAKKPTKIKLK